MNDLKNICAAFLLLSVVACDDKAATQTTQTQQFPDVNIFQETTVIDQLKASLISNPNDFATLSALGDHYFEAGQYLDAILTYDKAIAVNPACADCFNDKGLALYYTGDANAALASFDNAVALEPNYVHAWLSKGFVLFREGRYEEAVEPLNKVKELDTTGGLAAEAEKFLVKVNESLGQ